MEIFPPRKKSLRSLDTYLYHNLPSIKSAQKTTTMPFRASKVQAKVMETDDGEGWFGVGNPCVSSFSFPADLENSKCKQ